MIVNRLWHHHFGRGIVATPNDFGELGARPSHPKLLNWLAEELIKNGWHLKHIHRLILTSTKTTLVRGVLLGCKEGAEKLREDWQERRQRGDGRGGATLDWREHHSMTRTLERGRWHHAQAQ